MGVPIKSGSSGFEADVNIDKELLVNLPVDETKSGFSSMTSEVDAGDITGTRLTRSPEVTPDYRLRVANDNIIFNELFPGSAINTTLWSSPATTMTIAVNGGFLNLNAGLSVASGAVARATTYRHFPCYKTYSTFFELEAQFAQAPVSGNVCEWGAFISTGVATPTDGAFFRLTSTGDFRGVISFNGAETSTSSLDFNTLVGVGSTKAFLIYISSNQAQFWIENVLVGTIIIPNGQGYTTASMMLPLSFRTYNISATSAAQILKIGMVNITFGEQAMSKPWAHVVAGGGGHISQGQTGNILGSTALLTNSLAAGAGVAMTNTTAALGSGLGGQFTTQPTLAAGTDGIVSSYQVPLGTAALPGKSLYITRITVSAVVTAALTGGPVIYAYSLAYGHTSVSLATTESATTKAPRRLPVGIQSFVVTAPVGTAPSILDLDMTSPILVQPGEFVQLVAKNLGTVTSAGTITFMVSFGGYWE
jgi:hypothetical protein